MGTFRVEVQGVGGHGCQRNVGNGEKVELSCGSSGCIDCVTREYVTKLRQMGVMFMKNEDPNNDGHAVLTHWPGQKNQVVDDLLTRERTGSF